VALSQVELTGQRKELYHHLQISFVLSDPLCLLSHTLPHLGITNILVIIQIIKNLAEILFETKPTLN
jgi:hypothetical protein